MGAAGLKDVARAAGVSVTTVSRFLNGSLDLPDRTRGQVERAIRDLNYVPNPHARRLSLGRSDSIGLVVPDIATPFFSTLVAAVEAEADRRGLALALYATLNRAGREKSYSQRKPLATFVCSDVHVGALRLKGQMQPFRLRLVKGWTDHGKDT